MRVVLILLLFQFISPAFLPLAAQRVPGEENTEKTLHTEHSAILLPLILKEKDENEHEDVITTFELTQLIDFTNHNLALTQLHSSKYNPAPCQLRYNLEPPLFNLNCTFLI